jgi:hypothetical protein
LFKQRIEEYLWAIQKLPILLACTGLPIAYNYACLPKTMCVSSMEVFAQAVLDFVE